MFTNAFLESWRRLYPKHLPKKRATSANTKTGAGRADRRGGATSANLENENFRVFVRLHPNTTDLVSVESGSSPESSDTIDGFAFTRVLHRDASQQTVYDAVLAPDLEPTTTTSTEVDGVVCPTDRLNDGDREDGRGKEPNLTVFAYGATGSGKTHTLLGGSEGDSVDDGLIFRALSALYQRGDFPLRVSCVQIYKEQVLDLLANTEVTLVEKLINPGGGSGAVGGASGGLAGGAFEVANGVFADCETVLAATKVVQRAIASRVTRATARNEVSSRSHAVLTVVTRGGRKINFADLAGSERWGGDIFPFKSSCYR